MARRPFIDEPLSLLAVWSSRLALFGLAVAALSVLILRSGLLDIGPALATFGAGLAFAVAGDPVCARALSSRSGGRACPGSARALRGLVLGGALLAYPAYLGSKALKLPQIADITTDTANPPRFEALARERPKDRIAYPGAAAAELQHAAYPDIVPLAARSAGAHGLRTGAGIVVKHKWTIAEARSPAGARGTGVIEATARSLLMGFRDDVAIRISPAGTGSSRIDLRSASRVGAFDFGANAKRLRDLLDDLDEAAANAPEPRPEPEPEPAKKPAPPQKTLSQRASR